MKDQLFDSRDIRCLSVDSLRRLVRIANNTHEDLNNPYGQTLDAQGILDLAWAADDAGIDGFEAYLVMARIKALEVWSEATRQAATRQKRQKRAEERAVEYAASFQQSMDVADAVVMRSIMLERDGKE